MLTLEPHECRVLGVLIEKAQTTPGQYPLTLNGMTVGANQKNNRDPVLELTEEQVLAALDGLRSKGLVREVILSGSRVEKFRHVARDVLHVNDTQLVLLAELLLRGPQTVGELRGRASRMHLLESTEQVKSELDALMARSEPMVRELPPAPGDRASRFTQLLCSTLHPMDALRTQSSSLSGETSAQPGGAATASLEARLQRLEDEVAALRRQIANMQSVLSAT